ncbi:glycoside hydrolase family 19 protein [Chitinibacter sp. GC72]|uniref:glycoside hydrolase family 19 protein n=1 Tax=Chitinibacter sp. GC72 TaxID=1526917 RepID=UPI0012FBA987|nr:glycoside hydrolase family 19 protein [Chitinibacter sp. GC72]
MSAVFAANWQEGQTYTAGTQVNYLGSNYTALVTHTAYVGANWNPASTPTLWKLVTSGGTTTPPPVATATPSAAPTAAPTVAPTAVPTTVPTATPTTAPTATPTSAPTATPVAGGCSAPAWTAQVYSANSTVSYNGRTWKAQWYASASDVPKTVANSWDSPWQDLGACSGGGTTPAPTATPAPTVTTAPTIAPTATPVSIPTATPVGTATPVPTAPVTPGPVAAYKPQIMYIAAPAGYPTNAKFTADENALASQAGTDAGAIARIRAALRVLPDAQVEAVTVGGANNPDNVKRVERVLGQAKFDALFPARHINYTYLNFIKGVAKFPAYCDNYSDGRDADAICRKLLATSFAHFTQETGANWPALTPATARTYPEHNNAVLATMEQNTALPTYKQALWYLRENGYNEGSAVGSYQDCFSGAGSSIFSIFYPCAQNAQGKNIDYFGRGSKQLSWNYNFGAFSKSLYGDVNVLLDNPGRVADTWLNFASAIWFAVYPQSPKPPMTWVVDGTWVPNAVDVANNMSPGFGATVHIINGGIECGGGGAEKPQVQNRIAAYREFAREMGVTIPANEALGCAAMKGFQPGSAAATKAYLDKNWGYNANNPGGVSWACSLVDYQMPFSLANPGDYKACVDYMFRGQVKHNGQIVIDNTK